MRFMKDFKYCFFNLLAFIALFACDSNNNLSDYRENLLDTSKAEIITLDSIIDQNLNSDTTQNLISSFQHEDSISKAPLDVNSSFDINYNRKCMSFYLIAIERDTGLIISLSGPNKMHPILPTYFQLLGVNLR